MLKKLLILTAIISTALIISVSMITYGDGGNIVKNSGFEEVNGDIPTGWAPEAFDKSADAYKISAVDGKGINNSKCLVITNSKTNDSKVFQELKVEPNKVYKISCYIKTENILNKAGAANITVLNGKGVYTSVEYSDTKNDWKELSFMIKTTDSDSLKLGCRLGGFGTTNEGTAYFDNVSVELVGEAPAGTKVMDFFIPNTSSGSQTSSNGSQTGSSGSGKIILIVLAVVVIGGFIIFIETKFSKKAKTDNGNESVEVKKVIENKKDNSDEEEFNEEDYDE
ncbi:MAG: carbohydrate binding domain-containing protein [Bacillota bacterium]|nr:carbohydrate binding domain-containing protein [Bacillota bacterium]